MTPPRRSVSLRPSPLRLVLWGVGVLIIGVLAFQHDPGAIGRRLAETQRKAEQNASAPRSSFDVGTPADPAPAAGRTGLRFGVMARAAHLAALSGLEMNLFTFAAKDHGSVDGQVFAEATALEAALSQRELDAATIPLRTAVSLAAKMGAEAPCVVSGAAIGDEQVVVRQGFEADTLAGARVAVLERATLDLQAILAGSTVVLCGMDAIRNKLTTREIDAAILPQPYASQIAALSASTVDTARFTATPLIGGTVLVVSRALLDRQPELAAAVVQAHELAAFFVAQDPENSLARAMQLLGRKHRDPPPQFVWERAMQDVSVVTDLPMEPLQRLFALARDQQVLTHELDSAHWIRDDLLAEARRIRDSVDDH